MPKFIKLYNYPVQTVCIHINCMSPCDTCKQFVVFFCCTILMAIHGNHPFWSFLKEKNCLQRVPWTVRIWILTLVFDIAYAGASIITSCLQAFYDRSQHFNNGGWNFLKTCWRDWHWKLEMDWNWLRVVFCTPSPNLAFVGLAGALQVRYSFWPWLSWATGDLAKKLRPFTENVGLQWIHVPLCCHIAVVRSRPPYWWNMMCNFLIIPALKIEALVWDLADWPRAANLMGIRRSCSAFGITKPACA